MASVLQLADPLSAASFWLWANLFVYLGVFFTCLYLNNSFNTYLVGLVYLLPLVPAGLGLENAPRFLLVSLQNTVFGVIELAIFTATVRPGDAVFDKDHIRQLVGHVLPIAGALVGLSFVARASTDPVTGMQLAIILALFFSGAVLRVVAVCQIGLLGFKFDITFRAEQKIKTDQLYGLMRHPSYTAMMIVVLAYAVTTNSWLAGILGLASAWFGFQFRIHFEEAALLEQFGDEYAAYRGRTAMWLPLPGGGAQASDSRRQLGQEGERAAVEFLKKRGYRILQTNCRSSIGEIDIVAEHESVLVFIEVKTRTTSEFGHPFTAVTPAKQRKLAQLARGFLAKHKIQNRDCRFDVVGILGSDPKTRTIELLPNAFRCAP